MELSTAQQVEEARAYLATALASPVEVGMILGSGLGNLAKAVIGGLAVPFEHIPHFPIPSVSGHAGQLVCGELGGKRVVMLRGRPHFYEGYSPAEATFPIRVLAALGVRTLIVSNAAGGIDGSFRVGDLMLITDHINLPGLAGWNPLRGWHEDRGSSPFVSMQDAYDRLLRDLAVEVAQRSGIALRQGVYAMVAGPSYETPAEVRFLKAAGADAVGMSTAGEVIVARHCGMRVMGISCITNVVTGQAAEVSHEEVLAVTRAVEDRFTSLIRNILDSL